MSARPLGELLVLFRPELLGYVERHAGRLLRHESADDLVQGIHLRVLEQRARFEDRGDASFLAWVRTVARSHLADRHAYWSALRRRPVRLLRLVQDWTSDSRAAAEPAGTATGPSTFASRREQVDVAVRALGLLPDRDRDLVQWTCDAVPTAEQAARLGISCDAAERARSRAVERLRKMHAVISGGGARRG
jgi:RNA polymerase sigma factor (sigma-70 family)